jgi:hypothetical protein
MVRPFASVGLFVANQSESCWLLMFHSIHICSITCTYELQVNDKILHKHHGTDMEFTTSQKKKASMCFELFFL